MKRSNSGTTSRTHRRARPFAMVVLLVGVVLAVGAAVAVVMQMVGDESAVAVLVDDRYVSFDEVRGLPEEARLALRSDDSNVAAGSSGAEVVLLIAGLPVALRALTAAPAVAAGLLGLAAAIVLSRLLVAVAEGRPFDRSNVGRFRGLALLAVAYAIVPGGLANLGSAAVLARVDPAGTSPLGFTILDLSLAPFLLAGALLVMAEVFRQGGALTEDVEGLV